MEAPWWAGALTQRGGAWWLDAVDTGALAALPLRIRLAFMHGSEVMCLAQLSEANLAIVSSSALRPHQ